MKNALLALALFAFVGSASAHEGHNEGKGKKAKKETCSKGTAGASCCMKKDAKTAAATPAPATPAVKSL
ncbi:hypothetical protein K3G63_03775 [Hymenobacter sp. HSC-4F20]|uniref:hypothetical protein n=1 Tax=Hymenobacter sp. HSC-4F20 TaxID=2864135 RepID=UPI001C72C691|nr:hypothetical protein [Hymenobacter sp. HSC-4F20]MBX0289540.1 hypothetical protein [Hymenobacter sp. HSC-4F20]